MSDNMKNKNPALNQTDKASAAAPAAKPADKNQDRGAADKNAASQSQKSAR